MHADYVRRRVRIAGTATRHTPYAIRHTGMLPDQQRVHAGIKARLSLNRSNGRIVSGSRWIRKSKNTLPFPRFFPWQRIRIQGV